MSEENLAPNIFGWEQVSKFVDPAELPIAGKYAYCTVCKNTFSTVALFDRHRVHNRSFKPICNYPGTISKVTGLPIMIIGKRGFWINNNPKWSDDDEEE